MLQNYCSFSPEFGAVLNMENYLKHYWTELKEVQSLFQSLQESLRTHTPSVVSCTSYMTRSSIEAGLEKVIVIILQKKQNALVLPHRVSCVQAD